MAEPGMLLSNQVFIYGKNMDILFMKKLIYFVNFISHATNIDMTHDDSINGTRTGRGTDFRCAWEIQLLLA